MSQAPGRAQARRAGHRACDRLAQAVPASAELLQRAAARGDNLGSITAALLRLLDRYGARALQAAIAEALARGVRIPTRCAWRWSGPAMPAESRRRWRSRCPTAATRDADGAAHALNSYDRCAGTTTQPRSTRRSTSATRGRA